MTEYIKTICFDFDGVIHSYINGWQGAENIPDAPVKGIKEVIDKLRETGNKVVVQSSRAQTEAGKQAIVEYLNKNNIIADDVTSQKPAAFVYIDDRGLSFNGNTDGLFEAIITFKSWQEKLKENK